MSDDFTPLPPPKANETFGNLKTKRVRTSDGRKKRPSKSLVQFNVKVRSRVRSQIEAEYGAAREQAPDLTKGEFMERMLAAYQSGGGTAPVPSAADRAAGRTEALTMFATPALASVLDGRSKARGWTLGATIENACVLAKETESKRK